MPGQRLAKDLRSGLDSRQIDRPCWSPVGLGPVGADLTPCHGTLIKVSPGFTVRDDPLGRPSSGWSPYAADMGDRYVSHRRGADRFEPGRAPLPPEPNEGFLPRIDETDPRQPISRFREGGPVPPVSRPPREPGLGTRELVVPRVYIEPDESMDALRRTTMRLAGVRDSVLIVFLLLGIFYLGLVIWNARP